MYEYKWNTVPTMERTILCLHILKQINFITHMGFATEAIWNSLMASLENMWKACQKVRMCWIILVYSIAPGLVDTHIHGFGGVDVMDNNIEGTLHTMSEGLLSTGVTSFCLRP